MLSTDANILMDGSKTQNRMIFYSSVVSELYIIVLSNKKVGNKQIGNLYLKNINFYFKLFGLLKIFKIVKNILSNSKENFIITTQDEFTGVIGYFVKLFYKISWQAQIHSDIASPYFWKHSFKNKLRVALAKLFYKKADCIRVVSERVKRGIINWKGVDEKKIFILPIYVDLSKYFALYNEKKDIDVSRGVNILMASRLTSEKNIGIAIDAFYHLAKKYNNIILSIVGSGPLDKTLKRKVFKLGIEKKVKFRGWQENLVPYFKDADIFLSTSIYEGYGATIIEAMASGVPVIMTDVGVANDLVIDNKSGIIVSVNNTNITVNYLENLINNKSLYSSISENAYLSVNSILNNKTYKGALRQSYNFCLNK